MEIIRRENSFDLWNFCWFVKLFFQCCAMSFIDTLKAESVNMDPDEFESYTSGKKVPLGKFFWQSYNSVLHISVPHVLVFALNSQNIRDLNFQWNIEYSAAKQQISWVVSLWRSPLTFVWPGVPKQRMTTAPSSRSERHLTVFCIDEIVPGYVVYHVNFSPPGSW